MIARLARLQPLAVFVAIVAAMGRVLEPSSVLFYRDHAQVFRRLFFRVLSAYAHGRLPYWDPYVAGGEPLGANPNALAFSPFLSVFALPGGFDFTYDVFIVAHYFAAALSMLVLARALGLSRAASWCAAVAWALSGPLVSLNAVVATLESAALGPLALGLAIRLVESADLERIALFAIALALHAAAADPAILVADVVLFAVAAFGVKDDEQIGARIRMVLRPLLGVPLAVGLVSLQLILARDLVSQSTRAVGFTVEQVETLSLHPIRLLELFLPGISGEPEQYAFFSSMKDGGLFLASAYAGASALPLAVLAIFFPKPRRWLLACGLMLALALGRFLPLHALFVHVVPGLANARYPEKFLYGASIAFALAIGAALDAILAHPERARVLTKRALFPSVLAFALVAVLVFVAANGLLEPYRGSDGTFEDALPYWSRAVMHGIAAALAGALIIARAPREVVPAALTLLFAIDLGIAARPILPVADRAIYREPAIGRLVHADGLDPGLFVYEIGGGAPSSGHVATSEVASTDLAKLSFGTGAMFGFRYLLDGDLSQLRSLDWRVLEAAFREWSEPERYRALARLGITHLIVEADRTDIPGLTFVGSADGRSLSAFRIAGARGLAAAVHRLEEAPPDGVRAVRSLGASFSADVAIASRTAVEGVGARLRPGLTRIEALRLEEGRVTATVTSTVPAVIVVAQRFLPGWTSTVNGAPVDPIRVEALLVGVPVEAGTSELALEYAPPGAALGRAISVLSAVAFAALLIAGRARRMRRIARR
jgi:hypothetical protein